MTLHTGIRNGVFLTACLVTAAIAGAAHAAAARADLPLRRISLYRSGVGFFEHGGKIDGDASVRLRFETDRVNDVLKSLVALDLGGGRVEGALYEPKAPLRQRLGEFAIDLGRNPGVAALLAQVRGAEVRLRTSEGTVEGSVLSVERRPVLIKPGEGGEAKEDWSVNVLTGRGVQSVAQADIRSFEILDEALAGELREALRTVAAHRDNRSTEIAVRFAGEGERPVRIGFTHEAPVWKTSYRLVLPEASEGDIVLHGWAIVENDTDADWEGVELTLASGRPVSFVMDLQTPLILDRPRVAVPVIAGLGPVIYEQSQAHEPALDAQEEAAGTRRGLYSGRRAAAPQASMDFQAEEESSARFRRGARDWNEWRRQQAAASASEVGEQFVYTLDGPVTLERGGSAMLPILSEAIDARRVTIYSPSSGVQHPMRGVELTNDTGVHLMPGPIAVYDAGAFAGDAQVGHIARNQERLLSYAVDHDLEASREVETGQRVMRLRIVDGMLERTTVQRRTTSYLFTSRDGGSPRTVLVEHPKQPGYELTSPPEAIDETDSAHRFEVEVEPGETVVLSVVLERRTTPRLAVTDMDLKTVLAYAAEGKVSDDVMEAIRQAAAIQGRIDEQQQRISRLDDEREAIHSEQSRIRQNMARIDRRTDLYSRYMTKLDEQETRLEEIQRARSEAQRLRAEAQRELAEFLRNLDVE